MRRKPAFLWQQLAPGLGLWFCYPLSSHLPAVHMFNSLHSHYFVPCFSLVQLHGKSAGLQCCWHPMCSCACPIENTVQCCGVAVLQVRSGPWSSPCHCLALIQPPSLWDSEISHQVGWRRAEGWTMKTTLKQSCFPRRLLNLLWTATGGALEHRDVYTFLNPSVNRVWVHLDLCYINRNWLKWKTELGYNLWSVWIIAL